MKYLFVEKLKVLKAERDLERANLAFASLDSDESGRYMYMLYNALHFSEQNIIKWGFCDMQNEVFKWTKINMVTQKRTLLTQTILLICSVAMPTKTAYRNNVHPKLNMQISEFLVACKLPDSVAFVCMQLSNRNA